MKEKIKYFQAVISDYTTDEEKQSITVFFYVEHAAGIAHTHSLTFQDYMQNEKAVEFFENLPIFTEDEKIDFDSLEGLHVCLKFVSRGNEWEIADAEIDSLYYAIHSEDESETELCWEEENINEK